MKANIDKDVVIAWIDRFYHRAEVMREIQSGKAEKSRKADLRHTLATVVIGAVLTFVGFSGTERLSGLFGKGTGCVVHLVEGLTGKTFQASTSEAAQACSMSGTGMSFIDIFFNTTVLALFLASLLNLIYRWKEEHQALFQGVKRLTQYMHWLDEIKLRLDDSVEAWITKEVRMKYQIIVEQLPPNDERDFREAKARLKEKKALA